MLDSHTRYVDSSLHQRDDDSKPHFDLKRNALLYKENSKKGFNRCPINFSLTYQAAKSHTLID